MGRVHEIVIENFKSYEGRVQVGPFKKFTCVIGPNGAGKSNLMDAISFVLGVQARALRSEKMKDLIYRKEGEDPKKNQRTASVELTFFAEAGGEVEEKLVFKRLITKTGEARFLLDGEAVAQGDYHKRLEGVNILSKVRNFLVFQGDVEAVAQRQGKDLTTFFEQISGSEAFRQEYERLAAEKAKTEDNARYLFTKKRNAINEKKRVAQQKEEADEYRKLEGERDALQHESYLFRLHGVARQLEEAAKEKAKICEERRGVQEELNLCRKDLEAAEKDRAQSHLSTTKAERSLLAARAKLNKLNPEHVSTKSKLAFLRQRVEDLKQTVDTQERKKGKLASQATALREEQARLEAEERSIAERSEQNALRFTSEHREEFDRIRKETEQVVAASGQNSRRLENQIRTIAAERRKAEQDLVEAEGRQRHVQLRLTELKDAEQNASVAAGRSADRAAEVRSRVEALRGTTADSVDEKEQLQQERQQLVESIQDASATERQLEQEKQLQQVCSSLKGAVPGVHGRVLELCRPVQKRLHVPVNVAVGKFLDAVVVDTSETARRCVRYLKERLLPPMTFLPLHDLRVDGCDPRLGELANAHRALRLALNCISFDERFVRVFEFLLGDVVVADTMADGRRLAFTEARAVGVKCKVVTLAGEAIAKNGNLSVNSEATREGATRFDLSEYESSKARLEAVDRRLHDLHKVEAVEGADIATLEEEARRSEAKATEAKARLRWIHEQMTQKEADLHSIEAAAAAGRPEVARLAEEEARLREEQRDSEVRVNHSVKGRFAKLSKAMGVDDVLQLEREWRQEKEVAQSRADELARRLRNLRAELSMLDQTLQERSVTAPEILIPQLEAEIQELSKKDQAVSQNMQSLTSEVESCENNQRKCADDERDKDKVLQKFRQDSKVKRQQLMALEQRLSDVTSEENSLQSTRADILRHSVLENINIPTLGGGAAAIQDLAEAASQPANAPTQQEPQGALSIAIDFSALPEEKQAASVGPASKMLEEEYRHELERMRVELKRLSPNLKASEQMQGVTEHVQVAAHDADVARKEIEGVDVQFETVRKSRKERFLDCFQKVSGEISEVYRRLTANTAGLHSDGGSAYLDLEDTDDPFNGGVKFTAMPPAKRFRDMHLLSGGEKTLAAMALLFAVHAFQKPPFMVLDEVDAALDANNVRALAGYVEQADCQMIVISLKDRFFIRSEALVGVWKNKPQETSAVLTLDLSAYVKGRAQ